MLQSIFGHRTQRAPTRAAIPQISAADLQQRIESGEALTLIDVRTPAEYQLHGHISGSRLLPLSALSQRLEEVPKDRPVVFVCRSGARSQGACEFLAAQGFENVINLSGGMLAWMRAGLAYR